MGRGARGGLGGGLTAWVGRVARPLPGREREFGVYWIATFLINAGWGLTMPLLSVHLFETGMNLAAVGVIQALAGLAAFLSQGVLGTLSDRRATRRRYLILATGATVPVFLVLPHLRDGLSLALAVTFNGLLMATYITMLYTSVSALGRPGAAGRTFAVYRISGSIGWSITTLLLGWVLPWGGIVGAYRLGAGLFAVVTLFLVLGLRHRAGGPGIPEGPPGVPLAPGHEEAEDAAARVLETIPDPRRILRHRELQLFYLGISLFTFAQTAGSVYLPIYLREGLQVSDGFFGLLQAVPALGEIPCMLLFGRAGDRWGTARPLLAGYLVGVARWTLLPFLAEPVPLVAVQILQAISYSAGEILGVSHLAERIGVSARGTAVGILSSFQALGKVTAPVLTGFIGDAAGLPAVFLSAGGAMLLAAGLMDGSRRLEARAAGAIPEGTAPEGERPAGEGQRGGDGAGRWRRSLPEGAEGSQERT